MKETYHWYLPMGKEEEWLNEWIEKGNLNGIEVTGKICEGNGCKIIYMTAHMDDGTVEAAKSTPRHSLIEREQAVRDLISFHRAIASEMSSYLDELDRTMQDLVTITPLWLDSLRKRRALLSSLTDDED